MNLDFIKFKLTFPDRSGWEDFFRTIFFAIIFSYIVRVPFLLIFAGIFLSNRFPDRRNVIFFLTSMASWYYLPGLWNRLNPVISATDFSRDSVWVKIGILFVFLLVVWMLKYLFVSFFSKANPMVYLSSTLMLLYCLLLLVKTGAIFQLGTLLLGCLTCLFWYLVMFLEQSTKKAFKFSSNIGNLFPFFSPIYIPSYTANELASPSFSPVEVKLGQERGTRLAIYALIFFLLNCVLVKLFFSRDLREFTETIPSIFDKNLWGMSFDRQAQAQIPRSQYWIFFTADCLRFMNSLFYFPALVTGALAMLGIQSRLNFDKPYLANSFSQFFSRTMYYYSVLVQRYFFFPIYKRLSKIENLTHKIFVASFLAIFSSAWCFHFFRDLYLMRPNGANMFARSLNFLPYYFLLALVISVSLARRRDLTAAGESLIIIWIRRLWIFGSYNVLLFWVAIPRMMNTTPSQTWQIIKYMFGISQKLGS